MTNLPENSPASTNSRKPTESPVIVCDRWGKYRVYPATIETAKQLVQSKIADIGEDAVPGLALLKIRKAREANPADLSVPYLVNAEGVLRAMKDLILQDVGHESRAMYQLSVSGTPEKQVKVPTTKAQRDEFALWALDNKFKVESADASELERTRPEKSLSFMSGLVARTGGHPLRYVDESVVLEANTLEDLFYRDWSPSLSVENVVRCYLSFLNDYSHRDEKYHLGVMEAPVVAPVQTTVAPPVEA